MSMSEDNKKPRKENDDRATGAVKLARVMQIYAWMLDGLNGSKLHKKAQEQGWNVERRQVSRYILEASELMKEDLESYRESVLPDLIAKYLYLYERSMDRDLLQADWLAKAVLDSLSKFFHVDEKLENQEKQMSRTALIQSVEKLSNEIGIDILVQGKKLATDDNTGLSEDSTDV